MSGEPIPGRRWIMSGAAVAGWGWATSGEPAIGLRETDDESSGLEEDFSALIALSSSWTVCLTNPDSEASLLAGRLVVRSAAKASMSRLLSLLASRISVFI